MPSNFYQNLPIPDNDQIVNCIHCGMCLPVCPTYAISGLEKDSPRGRIRLIKAVAEGDLDLSENFKESLHFCLNCQACVTACPAGVEYGQMVEAAHLHIAAHDKQTGQSSRFREFILNWLFADLSRLKIMGRLMRLYQRSGMERVVRWSGILKLVSPRLHEMSFMSPPVPIQTGYRINGRVGSGTSRSVRVGLLPGCVQDVFFHDVNQDTIDVLKKNGYDVHIPSVNRCCGSVHGHNGNLETARQLARELIDAFESAQVDYVVMNSAGCGAYMKEYGHLLADDTDYAERALRFAQGVLDITELFDRQGWTPPKAEFTAKVTYHEPCHLVHAQKVSREPRELIRSIPGLDFRELSEATWCCGSAGIYNITRYEDSMKVLDRKMENIKKSGAEYVVTGNPGCMIQLIYGKKKFKLDVEIIHPVTLLSRAYQREGAF